MRWGVVGEEEKEIRASFTWLWLLLQGSAGPGERVGGLDQDGCHGNKKCIHGMGCTLEQEGLAWKALLETSRTFHGLKNQVK